MFNFILQKKEPFKIKFQKALNYFRNDQKLGMN